MIFVTVGTERFPFDRLLRAMDGIRDSLHGESLFMQTGHANYTPACDHERFLTFAEVRNRIHKASIVVSHAGVGTLLLCAKAGKVPIMMPRRHCFGEHVNDHQRMFARRISERRVILLVESSEDLVATVLRYDVLCASRKARFSREPSLVNGLKEILRKISDGQNNRSPYS